MTHRHTDGHRIYAIGDIHGCLYELEEVQLRIVDDLDARPHAAPVVVYLGDLGDRGPHPRGVIENLIERLDEPLATHVLRGNHDRCLMDFLDLDEAAHTMDFWLRSAWGGRQTLASYGVTGIDRHDIAEVQAAARAAVPRAHRDFLEGMLTSLRIGGYFFAHAGVRPGIPLDAQVEEDLAWIREPFLDDRRDFGAIVVHGHTVVRRVENRGNRIAVDTGAVFGGELSCLVLDGRDQMLLTEHGLVPCPVRR